MSFRKMCRSVYLVMETATENEWLVVFFVHEMVMFESITASVIQEIQDKGYGPNTSIYMLRDSVKEEDRVLYFRLSILKLEKKMFGRGFRFRKLRNVQFDNRSRRCWETGMQYIFKHEKFKRCMIYTLSHGAAFGLNRDVGTVHRPRHILQSFNLLKPRKLNIYSNPDFYFDQGEIGKIGKTLRLALTEAEWHEISKGRIKKDFKKRICRNLEILWTADLAAALERLPGKPIIDILLMANCYMQTFDTGYILRQSVKYVVAAETSIPADGYDLTKLLGYLDDTNMATEEIAKKIVDDYAIKQQDAPINLNFSVVSANKLSPYDDLFVVFLQVIKAIEAKMPVLVNELTAIRDKILYVAFARNNYNSNELRMIDVIWWMKKLFEKFPDVIATPELPAKIDALLNEIVTKKHVGEHFPTVDAAFENKFGINGVSVFYPTKQDYADLIDFVWCANFDERVPSPFRRDAEWDKFLKKYYSLA
jgi:hypothetical protein